jgi:hypothetical protein
MWTLPALLAAAHLLTLAIERHRSRSPGPETVRSTASPWKIIARSPYVLILVAALTLSVVVERSWTSSSSTTSYASIPTRTISRNSWEDSMSP